MSLKDFVVATSLLIASFSPSPGIEPGPFSWEYAPLPTQLQVPGHFSIGSTHCCIKFASWSRQWPGRLQTVWTSPSLNAKIFSGQSALAPFACCTFLELVLILQNSRPIVTPRISGEEWTQQLYCGTSHAIISRDDRRPPRYIEIFFMSYAPFPRT